MRLTARHAALAALLIAASPAAFAYEFVPTEGEFYSWPAYCRAKYVNTPIGEASQFARVISQDQVSAARAATGEAVFLHVHHYCSGVVWVQRGKAEPDPQQRKFFFTNAVGDLSYFTARVPPESGIMAKALYSLAEAYNGLGDRTTAMQTLTEAVQSHPENASTHVALGLFLRNNKDLAGALAALEHGVQVIGDSASAELDYDLALVLLESDRKEEAVKYARKAYELGYPLPGLRMKLARMGLWNPDLARK